MTADFDKDAEAPYHAPKRRERKQRERTANADEMIARANAKRARKAAKRLSAQPDGGTLG